MKHDRMWKKYVYIFILTLTQIIYLIPYLCYDFYNHFLETYQITDGQAGWLMTFFGAASIPGYLAGGWLSDKFNAKHMVVLSCFATAIVGFCLSYCHSFPMLVFLYFMLGVTSVCMHWTAFLKFIRSIGTKEEQGRLYGFSDIAYGCLNIGMAYGVLALLSTVLQDAGFRGAVQLYSAIAVVIGLITFFVIPYNPEQNLEDAEEKAPKVTLATVVKVAKIPLTWYLGIFTLGFYIIRSSVSYINPYMTDVFGVDIAFAAGFAMTIRWGTRMVAGPLGGTIRDKMGRSTPVVMVGGIGATVFTIMLMMVPHNPKNFIYLAIFAALFVFFSSLLSNNMFTPVSEAGIPFAYSGTMLGIASAIGYSSDLWLYIVCGNFLDKFGNDGYTYIFGLQTAAGLMLIVSGILMARFYKKVKKDKSIIEKLEA